MSDTMVGKVAKGFSAKNISILVFMMGLALMVAIGASTAFGCDLSIGSSGLDLDCHNHAVKSEK